MVHGNGLGGFILLASNRVKIYLKYFKILEEDHQVTITAFFDLVNLLMITFVYLHSRTNRSDFKQIPAKMNHIVRPTSVWLLFEQSSEILRINGGFSFCPPPRIWKGCFCWALIDTMGTEPLRTIGTAIFFAYRFFFVVYSIYISIKVPPINKT